MEGIGATTTDLRQSAIPRDELGPLRIVEVHEPRTGLRAALVVDNVAIGPSIGGVRMAPDVSLTECARLARAMTLKNAAAGLRHGGGKAILYGDPKMPKPEKERLIRALARALQYDQDYIFGPDMGTDEECMAWVYDEIRRAAGLPQALGGIPLDEIGATGWGLRHAAEVAASHCGMSLKNARIAVQGFGAVGKHAARFLAEQGAVLVAAADTTATIHDPKGLDIPALIAWKDAGKPLSAYAKGAKLATDAIVEVECDIWIPAARPDVLNAGNIRSLKAKMVLQGANIPATAEAEAYMHSHGILNVPDFIANAGGVICAATEYQGLGETAAFQAIAEKVSRNTMLVLEDAKKRNVLPRQAAVDLAAGRVKAAMATRRHAIF
jgi:glutamate dehydrogenase (NAD(P)+)